MSHRQNGHQSILDRMSGHHLEPEESAQNGRRHLHLQVSRVFSQTYPWTCLKRSELEWGDMLQSSVFEPPLRLEFSGIRTPYIFHATH
eukprot:Gb_34120 [translate_table: standard]